MDTKRSPSYERGQFTFLTSLTGLKAHQIDIPNDFWALVCEAVTDKNLLRFFDILCSQYKRMYMTNRIYHRNMYLASDNL